MIMIVYMWFVAILIQTSESQFQFPGFSNFQLEKPSAVGKESGYSSISPEAMESLSLKVIKTVTDTRPESCLQSCEGEKGCVRAIHCVDGDPCVFGTACTLSTDDAGTCYLTGTEGTDVTPNTNCRISKLDKSALNIQLEGPGKSNEPNNLEQNSGISSSFLSPPFIGFDPTKLSHGQPPNSEPQEQVTVESEKTVPATCQVEPSYMNQGAVKKTVTDKNGYPVVIEYECNQQGEETYKYATGTTEAMCDEDGKWTLPALTCIPTSCYVLQKDRKGRVKASYAGEVNRTETDLDCQGWAYDTPHSHKAFYKRKTVYPADRSPDFVGNKCRDPDGEKKPWCYTVDPSIRWTFCQVKECNEVVKCGTHPHVPGARPIITEIEGDSVTVVYTCVDGLVYDSGNDRASCSMNSGNWTWPDMLCYSSECYYFDNERREKAIFKGNIMSTTSGRTCQRWDSQEPHKHDGSNEVSDFPGETSMEDIDNKCRDGDGETIPWCYTTDPDKRWEFCDIPECDLN